MSPRTIYSRLETWIALALCATVFAAGAVGLILPDRPAYAGAFAPGWLMAGWVFALFYGSWALWALAAGAATRSYQLRSAALRMSSPT